MSPEAISKAVKDGRIERAVVRVNGQPKIGDAELADRELDAHTRPSLAAPEWDGDPDEPDPDEADLPAEHISYKEARRRREVELWRQARAKREGDELDLAERKGEVVPIDDARQAVVAAYTVVKTKLLGLPSRVKQRLPNVSADDVRVIDDLVRAALEELADGGDDGGGS